MPASTEVAPLSLNVCYDLPTPVTQMSSGESAGECATPEDQPVSSLSLDL